jgi:hypothetical protein
MNRIAGLGTAVATAAAATALAASAVAASAHDVTTTHTLTFTSRQINATQVGQTVQLAADRDLRRGKTIGYDASSCHFDFAANEAHCRVAVTFKNGSMVGRFTFHADTNTARGVIVDGTGVYANATGTVRAHQGSRASDTIVTLQYQT